jgi:S1-C subfamily serine protease
MSFFTRLHVKLALVIVTAAVAAGVASAALRQSAAQIGTGVVVINTNLAYQDGAAAGTGMVLTSSGEILTNNHVINGATSIRVVVPGTGHSYAATVVGYSRTRDVAVIQLKNASNLKTISVGGAVTVGQSVTGLGNAGGTGRLTRVSGKVTAVGRSIVASDETGNSERLVGLIETNAPLVAGDSGGPLLDASGNVVGMDTAASSSFSFVSRASVGFAIPIAKALSLAQQIESGKSFSTVHIGPTAFLGVSVQTAGDGAGIAAVVQGGPADRAGLVEGDIITAVNGTAITSSKQIQLLVLAKKPGDKLRIAYTDQYGDPRVVTATLGSGPPQ